MPWHWACLVRGGVPDHYPPGHRMPSVWIMHARERVCKTCAHQIYSLFTFNIVSLPESTSKAYVLAVTTFTKTAMSAVAILAILTKQPNIA